MDPHIEGERGTTSAPFRFNKQLPEIPTSNPATLDVHSIFPTIQGEGPFAGEPAVFIRLAGCNIQCLGCDTDYTEGRHEMRLDEIVKEVRRVAHHNRLVVITGGEPFRQNIGNLVMWLSDYDFRIQIETNGTIFPENFPWWNVAVVCSPKTETIDPKLAEKVIAWKYVVQAPSQGGEPSLEDGLPLYILGRKRRVARPPTVLGTLPRIYVQPFDSGDPEKNKANLQAAIWSAQTYGYRLCIQIHKIIGME